MAYNLQYTFKFVGNQTGDQYQVKLYKDGFGGTARTFTSGWGPRECATIKTDETEQDPLFPIRPKTFELRLIIGSLDDIGNAFTETNFSDIVFSNDRDIKVEVLQASSIIFVGWFTPQQSVTFSNYKFGECTLVFTDGLASLKGIAYKLPDDYSYQLYTLRKFITDSLAETGLGLDIRYSNSLYAASNNVMLIDEAALETTAVIEDNGTVTISCWDLLTKLMRTIGCTLYQRENKWHIDNFADKSQADEWSATILNSNPTQGLTMTQGTFATDTLITSTRQSTERSMYTTLFQPKSRVNASVKFSQHIHVGLNYFFRDFTGNNADNWTYTTNLVTQPSGTYGVQIQGYSVTSLGSFTAESIRSTGMQVKKGDRILVDWLFELLQGASQPVEPRVSIRVDGTNYLQADGTWNTTDQWIMGEYSGVFADPITIENDGMLYFYIGRPDIDDPGEDQNDYYVECVFMDVTLLNGFRQNEEITQKFGMVQWLTYTPNKTIYNDDDIFSIGMNADEAPVPGVLLDHFVSLLKVPSTRANLGNIIQSAEILSGQRSLLQQISLIRGRLFTGGFVSVEANLIGPLIDLFKIYTATILGSSRRLVCIGIENSLHTERQRAVLVEAKLGDQGNLNSYVNYKE